MLCGACGGNSPKAKTEGTGTGTPTATATAPTSSIRWPTCLQPEFRPTFWTPNCGDAGSSLNDITYTSWDETEARGQAAFKVTKGGPYFEAQVTFVLDRPVQTPDFGKVFSRLTVRFPTSGGPDREQVTTTDLGAMLADARILIAEVGAAQQTPCVPPECAPDPSQS